MMKRRDLFKRLFGFLTAVFCVGKSEAYNTGKKYSYKCEIPVTKRSGVQYVCDLPEGCERITTNGNNTIYTWNNTEVYQFNFDSNEFELLDSDTYVWVEFDGTYLRIKPNGRVYNFDFKKKQWRLRRAHD